VASNILLVEDDSSIGEMVESYLTMEGFQVVLAKDGEEALERFAKRDYDLVLLDMMLPKISGMDFLKKIREKSHVPVLIVSAKDGEVDKAIGLGFGADDYITKPFSMIELTARVKAAIRRVTAYAIAPPTEQNKMIQVHELEMDLDHLTVTKNGQEIKLTAKELQILKLFMTNPKKVFTKQHIFTSVWNDDYFGDENVINVHMSRLRDKIEDQPSDPQYIKTLWGIGYRLGEF